MMHCEQGLLQSKAPAGPYMLGLFVAPSWSVGHHHFTMMERSGLWWMSQLYSQHLTSRWLAASLPVQCSV